MTNAATISFDKMTTSDGVQECFMVADNNHVGTLSRERPCRYAAGARLGLARDMSRPYVYEVEVDGVALDIPDGADLRDVKRAMVAAYLSR
jgi:hypothetical protein